MKTYETLNDRARISSTKLHEALKTLSGKELDDDSLSEVLNANPPKESTDEEIKVKAPVVTPPECLVDRFKPLAAAAGTLEGVDLKEIYSLCNAVLALVITDENNRGDLEMVIDGFQLSYAGGTLASIALANPERSSVSLDKHYVQSHRPLSLWEALRCLLPLPNNAVLLVSSENGKYTIEKLDSKKYEEYLNTEYVSLRRFDGYYYGPKDRRAGRCGVVASLGMLDLVIKDSLVTDDPRLDF